MFLKKLEIIAQKNKFLTFLRDTVKHKKPIQNLITQNKNQNIIYLGKENLYGYAMSTFLLKKGFKWIGPKYFDLNKYSSNSSKDAFLILNILKELCESHNDYPLSLDKVEIK